MMIVDTQYINSLKEACSGAGEEYFQSLKELYLEQAFQLLSQAKKIHNSEENTEWKHLLHKLKGSSASIGASKIVEICKDFEKLEEDRLANLDRQGQINQLEQALEVTQSELEKVI